MKSDIYFGDSLGDLVLGRLHEFPEVAKLFEDRRILRTYSMWARMFANACNQSYPLPLYAAGFPNSFKFIWLFGYSGFHIWWLHNGERCEVQPAGEKELLELYDDGHMGSATVIVHSGTEKFRYGGQGNVGGDTNVDVTRVEVYEHGDAFRRKLEIITHRGTDIITRYWKQDAPRKDKEQECPVFRKPDLHILQCPDKPVDEAPKGGETCADPTPKT